MQTIRQVARRRPAQVFCAALIAAALSACGGGGGSDSGGGSVPQDSGATSTALSSSNYVAVAQQVVSSANYVLGSASLLTGAQSATPQAMTRFGIDQALRMNRWFTSQSPAVVGGASQTETDNCTGGGTMTVTITDANNNGQVDVGDGITIQANNCVEDGATMSGGLKVSISAVTGVFGADTYTATLALTFTNFVASLGGGDSITGNGQMNLGISASGGNRFSVTVDVPNFDASGKLGGAAYTQKMSGYRMSLATVTSAGVTTATSSVSGTLSGSALDGKKITIETPQPFVEASNQSAPSSGQVIIHGASNSQLRLTVQAGGMVLLELDADGNGTFETASTQSWGSLN